jgi:predicted O-methyltransferase YrrM
MIPVDHAFPTSALNVLGPNAVTVDFFAASGCRRYAEIGIYEGDTALAVGRALAGDGELHLFDFEDRVDAAMRRLAEAGVGNAVAHPNSRRLLDSYNWSLMMLLAEHEGPIFDYVFIDGAHTWAFDALAFLLVDRLLAPGGYVDFDDYHWTLAASPSMSPEAFPPTRRHYTDEQIREPQVALVVDLLVRPDDRYEEVVESKIFRKRAEAP